MVDRSPFSRTLRTFCAWLIIASALLAASFLLFHHVAVQRQYDTQLINYSLEFLRSIKEGGMKEFLTTPRKYPLFLPMLMSIPFAVVLGTLFLMGDIRTNADAYAYLFGHPIALNVAGRLFVAFSAFLALLLVHRIARKIFPRNNPLFAVVLLASSILFLTFTSAVRVHVPMVCMSLLAFSLALPLFERKSFRTECFAFLASAAAFASLQSGIFTLMFPVIAFLSMDGKLVLRRALCPRLWCWIIVWGVVSGVIGYPFLLSSLLSTGHVGFGLGNQAFDTQLFGFSGVLSWEYLLLGSEVFLFYFLCRYFLSLIVQRKKMPFLAAVLLTYACAFSLFFSVVEATAPRMVLPVIAVFSIVASPALEAATIGEWLLFTLCIVAVNLRFAWFASLPDTWQSAHDFLQTRTHGTIATDLPMYFLDIPPTRSSVRKSNVPRYQWLSGLSADLPDARSFVPSKDWNTANVYITFLQVSPLPYGKDWHRCAHFISGPTDESMFLWVEMKYALWMLLRGHALGPSLVVYCRH